MDREFTAQEIPPHHHKDDCKNIAVNTTQDTGTHRAASTHHYSMNSLLTNALEVPILDHPASDRSSLEEDDHEAWEETASSLSSSTTLTQRTTGGVSLNLAASPPPTMGPITAASIYGSYHRGSPAFNTSQPLDDLVLPQHSDFTIPTSNARCLGERHVDFEKGPPLEISPPNNSKNRSNNGPISRRTVFGMSVGKRYRVPPAAANHHRRENTNENHRIRDDDINSHGSALSPPASPTPVTYMISQVLEPSPVSPLTPSQALYKSKNNNDHNGIIVVDDDDDDDDDDIGGTDFPKELQIAPRRFLDSRRRTTFHETIHAQSLLLGLAFMAVWSPNNAMAPNLTQMADSFHMSEAERDLYLGSYCALALGVFSLPISALLGFMADFYSRKHLFIACVVGGSLASAWTGWSKTFASLFLARLMSGGCMSASVPVAFSLLGDLFSIEERNAASSGLSAMMGLGILLGQVYAGTIGPNVGWQFPFYVSAGLSVSTAVLVILWVREPARGAKEKALQGLLQSGNKYERQLTLTGFIHAMRHNRSNTVLLWQGFFTSLPWGIVFVFLNDYLSQEKGFSVPDATFMVMLFGCGCAIGGILGGYIGQVCQQQNRSMLPLFMAVATFCGIIPFLALLNSEFPNKHGYKAMGYSILGGCIASLPSASVRPCILNVNPPETRGAALTAANLLITLGRGMGPSCITLMGSMFNISRQSSFNITLSVFWTISSIQLLFLAKTLPKDQDSMEEGLARYAAELAQQQQDAERGLNGFSMSPRGKNGPALGAQHIEQEPLVVPMTPRSTSSEHQLPDGESLVSIEDYMTSFDGIAVRRTLQFVQQGFKEITDEMASLRHTCGPCSIDKQDRDDDEAMEEILPQEELRKRQTMWKRQQQSLSKNDQYDSQGPSNTDNSHEQTPLLGRL